MRNLPRLILWLGVFTLWQAAQGRADEAQVQCFLVDSRIHVAVVSAEAGTEGELVWRDTVTGESGEAPFTAQGDRLLLRGPGPDLVLARMLPALAIVLEHPPWGRRGRGPALGIALN